MIFSDVIVFIAWLWNNTILIVKAILAPLKFLFVFLQNFAVQAFASPIQSEEIWAFDSQITGIFNAIPYWSILIKVLLLSILIVIGFAYLKTFHKT